MKRLGSLLFLFLFALAVGAAAFSVQRHCLLSAGSNGRAELEWLRSEYKLTKEQYARVVALHQTYGSTCQQICAKIVEKNEEIDHLVRAHATAMSPLLEQALRQEGALRAACRTSMFEHLYAVSRQMSPEQGKRYLEMMASQITCPASDGARSQHSHHDGQ